MTSAEIDELRRKHYNATVVYLAKPHSDLMIVRIKPDFPISAHKPGQYGTIGMGQWEPRALGCQEEAPPKPADEHKLIRRAYSISNSVLGDHGMLMDIDLTNAPWLEFYIVLVREAEKAPALTPRLFMLNQGDRIFLGEKIAGHFTLDPVKPNDAVVFLSTGTGEAPHNYMLWQLLRRDHPGRILSACCVRYRRDLGYLDTQEELMRRYANYVYLPLTTREAATVEHKVYIQDLIASGQLEQRLGQALDPKSAHVFLCGNPKMIGVPNIDRASGKMEFPSPIGVVELLSRRQFQIDQPGLKMVGNIHYEEYW